MTFPDNFGTFKISKFELPELGFLKKMTFRAWFKTAQNPTCRKPSGSTQEPPNSLLSHSPSHSEPFLAWSPKILVPIKTYPLALCRVSAHAGLQSPRTKAPFEPASPSTTQAILMKHRIRASCLIGPKGAKGGSRVGPPRGYFGRNRRKSVETPQPMRQKAI